MSSITLPNVFVPGQILTATELNQNFQTIYTDYNGNITNVNISGSAAVSLSKININATALSLQTTGVVSWAAGTTGDTQPRVAMTSAGKLEFGPGGSTAPDVDFQRSATTTIQLQPSGSTIDMNNGSFINVSSLSGSSAPAVCGGRVYMTTGAPYTNHAAATTIFFGPAISNQININGTVQTFSEVSLAIGALSTGMYDVYVNSASSTTVGLSTSVWGGLNTPPTRGTDIYGRLTKDAAAGFLLVASIYINGSNQVEDDASLRGIGNVYNLAPRNLFSQVPATSWTPSGGTWGATDTNTTYGEGRVGVVSPIANFTGVNVTYSQPGEVEVSGGADSLYFTAIGLDSTSTPSSSIGDIETRTASVPVTLKFVATSTILYAPTALTAGFHYLQMLENATNVVTAYGNATRTNALTGITMQ